MIEVKPEDRAALRMPWAPLVRNKVRELWTKARGGRIRGQGMIGADERSVAQGFLALRDGDFDIYNLPQVWVESRQIPRAINARIPAGRATVVDLGCGPGTSTRVLCHFASPGWSVIGYDLMPHYVEAARRRAESGRFRTRSGAVVRPRFVCQDISRPLSHPEGGTLADASVDFAISGGVVGLYMNDDSAQRLARELARVVRPGGFAALDAGPAVPEAALRRIVAGAGFRPVGKAKSFIIEPRPKIVFERLA
jgi:SAM-dependent methyltransferase